MTAQYTDEEGDDTLYDERIGAGLPELVGKYLGGRTKKVMLVFSVLLLPLNIPGASVRTFR